MGKITVNVVGKVIEIEGFSKFGYSIVTVEVGKRSQIVMKVPRPHELELGTEIDVDLSWGKLNASTTNLLTTKRL